MYRQAIPARIGPGHDQPAIVCPEACLRLPPRTTGRQRQSGETEPCVTPGQNPASGAVPGAGGPAVCPDAASPGSRPLSPDAAVGLAGVRSSPAEAAGYGWGPAGRACGAGQGPPRSPRLSLGRCGGQRTSMPAAAATRGASGGGVLESETASSPTVGEGDPKEERARCEGGGPCGELSPVAADLCLQLAGARRGDCPHTGAARACVPRLQRARCEGVESKAQTGRCEDHAESPATEQGVARKIALSRIVMLYVEQWEQRRPGRSSPWGSWSPYGGARGEEVRKGGEGNQPLTAPRQGPRRGSRAACRT